MIVTTYTCDRCGHSQTTKDNMWEIKLNFNNLGASVYGVHGYNKLWCKACCQLFPQLLMETPKNPEPSTPPPPTLEDLLRDLIKEEIANAT